MLISKRSFLNLTRSKIGIIRIWEKRRTEGVEKSASRNIRAAQSKNAKLKTRQALNPTLLLASPVQACCHLE
jgi:hypothetical protein